MITLSNTSCKNKAGSKKIGIITWHCFENFGSALQAAALVNTIRALGYDAKILNYRKNKGLSALGRKLRCVLGAIVELLPIKKLERFAYFFLRFQEKYLHQTKVLLKADLQEAARKFDKIICGSDQIWAPNVFEPVYMLDFVADKAKKASYAASVGLNDIPDVLVPQYRQLLLDFSDISVREEAGAKLLKEKCGIDSQVVLDPTLLVEAKTWSKIEKKPNGIKAKFLFCYLLNANHKYKDLIISYAKQKNLEIVGWSANQEDAVWISDTCRHISPEHFIWLIHHADAVITDSYHGTVFSLLFHKAFLTFERFDNNDVICQNSRIYQLDKYFGVSNRICVCTDAKEIEIPAMDFMAFEDRLNQLREESKGYLLQVLEK